VIQLLCWYYNFNILLVFFSEKINKNIINTKGYRSFIAKKGYKNFSNNKYYNVKGNKDIYIKEDEDINIKEDKDINIKENKDINIKKDKDINTKKNEDCNTILYKLIARFKADSDIGFNKFSILTKLRQNISPINAKALIKVFKSNTASKYIASINKFTDLVNQSGFFKLNIFIKNCKN